MKSTIRRRAIIVGLFLFFSLIILVAGILTIGNLHNSFVRKFTITTVFDEVNGLQPGNNIWFSGVKIGTVKSLDFYGRSQVRVSMKIDQEAQPYIRRDAKAKISTDGLIGNKIIVIYGGSDQAPTITEGDTLGIEKTVSTEEMMITLQENNRNILEITNDFKSIIRKIRDGKGSVGKLLTEDDLYDNLAITVTSLRNASAEVGKLTGSLADFGAKLNTEGHLANDLVTDTVLFATIQNTITELHQIALSASQLTASLKQAGAGLNDRGTVAGTLLHDEAAGSDLKSTIRNLESSTQKLNEDLEALQHNFLLRGYFRKKERQ